MLGTGVVLRILLNHQPLWSLGDPSKQVGISRRRRQVGHRWKERFWLAFRVWFDRQIHREQNADKRVWPTRPRT